MRYLIAFLSGIFSLTVLLSCDTLKGVEIGGVKLDPFVSAGEKLAQSGTTSESDEIELGGHMAATLLGASPLVNDAALQRYVNRVGVYVALQSSRPNLPWRFGVLEDAGYNAFAAPGGYIFITRGLLNDLSSEAELAGVLGHEITHVIEKHHLHAVQKSKLMGAAGDIAGYFADRHLQQSGAENAKLKKEVAQRIVNATKELYSRGLDKDDEFSADSKGMSLAARAGYDPYALIAVLQKLQARSADDSNFALLFKTHPRPDDRLKALEAMLDSDFGQRKFALLTERFSKETRK